MVILFTSLSDRYAFVRRGSLAPAIIVSHSRIVRSVDFPSRGRVRSPGKREKLLETARFVRSERRETEKQGGGKIYRRLRRIRSKRGRLFSLDQKSCLFCVFNKKI